MTRLKRLSLTYKMLRITIFKRKRFMNRKCNKFRSSNRIKLCQMALDLSQMEPVIIVLRPLVLLAQQGHSDLLLKEA